MAAGANEKQMSKKWNPLITELLIVVLIGGVALVLRAADLGLFVTHDEIEFWIGRSESLLRALRHGDFSLMAVSTHPGVTTMWLGAGGIVLRRLLFEQGVLTSETFPIILSLHRLPVVLTHTVMLLVSYGLLRRLLPTTVAILATMLWAADPFVVAYSRLLHVDALMGSFATLSLLAGCLFWHRGQHPGWLVLSGVGAGLAMLSKSPALALGPVVSGLALAAGMREWGERGWRRGAVSLFLPLLAWGGVVALTIVALCPALLVSPARVYEALRVGVEVEGASPHMTGNFFLGRRVAAPGVLFYPVVLALRTTPLTLGGLLLLPFALVSASRGGRDEGILSRIAWRDLATLAGFVLVLVAGLSLFPKKFNRYLVPAFPALDILAAVGLVWGIHWLVQRVRAMRRLRSNVRFLAGSVALAAVINAGWWHPYSIVAFNQLFGGASAGARTFAVGWGEGLEQVADWLNRQPDSDDVLTISHMITSLNPYLREGARATFPDLSGQLKEGAGYVVVTISQVQGGSPVPPFNQFFNRAPPLHRVTIHGVDYAWIYQAPPGVAHRRPSTFGNSIYFYGYSREGGAQPGQEIRFKLVWQPCDSLAADYWFFAHLIGPDGKKYAQINQPYATSQWGAGRFVSTEMLLLLPHNLPPGAYLVTAGLFDMQQNRRLPLDSATVADSAVAGPHALLLDHITIAPHPEPEQQ
jgi:hypothetical protein